MLAGIPARPGQAGWRGQVDAVYSIEAMVHVDLQYLMAYLLTAAAALRPEGKLIMTLATMNSDHGFGKLLRDVRNFWDARATRRQRQARMAERRPGRSHPPAAGIRGGSIWEPGGPSLGVVASLRRPEAGDQLATVPEVSDRETGKNSVFAGTGTAT